MGKVAPKAFDPMHNWTCFRPYRPEADGCWEMKWVGL